MKLKDIKKVLADIEDAQGPEVEVIFETPREDYFQPDVEAGWYEDEWKDGQDAVYVPISKISG